MSNRLAELELTGWQGNWWFRINWWGTCTAASGTTVSGIGGYKGGPHSVGAYSDSSCDNQIASAEFTVEDPVLSATVNSDWSVDLALANGPANWWFRIGAGACTAGPASAIRGYTAGGHGAAAFEDSSCATFLTETWFVIPTATLAATVNSDKTVDLALTGGPASWWFRINWWGTCTPVSGTTISGIGGYKGGPHSVGAYSDSGCDYHIASSSFTIPDTALTATVNSDWSVDLALANGPANWWYRINWWGACTPVSGTTISGIRGYRSGTHVVAVFANDSCGSHGSIAGAQFTIPTATLSTTVHNDRSVDLTLANGPANWWFRINWWGTCTPVSGTTITGIRGYQTGTYEIWSYSDSGCTYRVAQSSFTIAATALSVGSITATSAVLTLSSHSGNWYYKATTGPHTGCSSAQTGAATLDSLTLGDSYTYTAYGDSACTTALATPVSFTTALAAPAQPTGLSLTSGDTEIAAAWTAPSNDGGSAIFDYDVRYRQTGTNDWSEVSSLVTHNPGTRFPVKTDPDCTFSCDYIYEDSDANSGDAISLGTVSLSGITVTKPTLTGVNDVYLLGSAVSDLRVQLAIQIDHFGIGSSNWRARYASTAPTASNMHTHGTLIWEFTASGNQTTTGNGWTGPLPSSTYFWVAATGLDDLDVIDGVTPLVQAEVPISGTTSTITGLTNGTEYEVQVRAVNAVGNGAWSTAATLKSGLPAAPASPVLASGTGSLTATWTAPAANGSAITDYDVAYCATGCASDASWTDVAHSGTTATAAIANLTDGTTYQVRVRATNSVGTGPWSIPATGTPGAPATPTAPTLASGNAQITATWTAPAANGSTITDYDLRYRISDTNSTQTGNQPGPWLSMPDSTNSTAETATISDATNGTNSALANNTAYDVQVRAGNARGDGGWSPSATIKPGLPNKPNAPTLTAGTRKLTVAWTAPTINGLAITDYDVRYRKSTDTTWISHPHTGTGTSTDITGLQAVAYQVQVRASSTAGAGPWSNTATATPNAGKPDTPAAPTLEPGGTQITVRWTAPYNGGSNITDYDVQYCSTGCNTNSNWTEWNSTDTSTTTNATITGLTNGTVYQVQVRATNTHGDSDWSSSTSQAAGAPSAPSAPTLTAGAAKLTVSWTAPTQNAGAIDDYDVRYRQAGTTNWTRVFDGGSTSLHQTPFTSDASNRTDDPIDFGTFNSPGSNYITREALNSKNGLYKVTTAIDEMEIELNVVSGGDYELRKGTSKPTGLATGTVLATSSSRRIRSWLGYFAVGDYFWAIPTASTTSHSRRMNQLHAIDLATTTTTYELGGLTNGTAYEVQVRAGNTHGDSPWSPLATATPAKTLEASSITSTGATLTVADHSGNWYYKATTGPHTGCSSAQTGAATLASLTPGASYTYTAYSDSACTTALSTPVSFTTQAVAPAQPTALSLTSGDTQIAAAWTAPTDDGGSDIFDYDVHYRQTGTTEWSKVSSLVTHNPGTRYPVKTDPDCAFSCDYTYEDTDANTGDAISLGTVSLSGITVTKPTLTGVNDVYLLGSAVSDLRVQLAVAIDHFGIGSSNWRARYASTAPTASNMHTHGTLIWEFTASGNQTTTGNGWTGPLPSGTYFWVAATGLDDLDVIDGVTPLVQAEVPLTETTATITGLTNGTEYEVQVRAVNAAGNGAWAATATLKAGLPAAPASPVLASSAGSLTAAWTASGNGSAITDYDVAYCSTGCANSASWTDVAHSGTTATATITGLTDGTTYQVRVRATNSVGTGPWSAPASGTPGAPDTPAAPTLASGNAQITATWTAPAANGSSITDYDVRYRISDTNSTQTGNQPGPWLSMPDSTNSTATSLTISNATNGTHPALVNNTAYDVQVRAGNARGDGGWSPSASIKPGLPNKPNAPTLTAGTRKLTVAWSGTANGLAITDYDVQYRKSTDTTWTNHPHTGTGTSADITELQAVAYQVQVRASSTAGAGPWSDSATATPNAGKPDTPAAPTLEPGGTQITVNWTAPYNGGSNITDYDVRYCSTGCNTNSNWTEWNSTNTSTNTTATITGLTNGTVYQVQVRATNTHGDSGWSPSTSQAAGAPSAPSAPTLTAGAAKLTVSWTAPAQNAGAIDDYDVRYRQTGTNNWTRIYDGGSTSQHQTSPGVTDDSNRTNDPIDFADFNSPGSNYITNRQHGTSSKWGLYEITTAIDEMEIELNAFTGGGGDYQLRKGSSKPTSLATGTVLATSSNRYIRRWVGSFAVGDYFWAIPTGSTGRYVQRSNRLHAIDLATTTTTYVLSGLTNGTSYEVQVRAGNTHGDSPWSPLATATPSAG